MLVPEPTTVHALDTDRIAARPDALANTRICQALYGATGCRSSCRRGSSRRCRTAAGRAPFRCPGQGLLIDLSGSARRARLRIHLEGAVADFVVRVMNDRNGRVIRSRDFRYVVPVTASGNAAIVQALDQAMDQAFVEIADWALG